MNTEIYYCLLEIACKGNVSHISVIQQSCSLHLPKSTQCHAGTPQLAQQTPKLVGEP